MQKQIRPIAFYLPQFHPIPENDEWWGKGFTEWTNVTKAKPLFKGHYQPHLPADLGFYDLRLEEVRIQQAQLAQEHGIYGFCYYHYWFNGRRLLERPFQEVLKSGKPDFPFMLCWANENWSRRWNGSEHDILLSQTYSHNDDLAHIGSLLPVFNDPRYIKVDGKPVFSIHRANAIPDVKSMLACWRNEAAKSGMELYLVKVEGSWELGTDYLEQGFDAAITFEPFSYRLEEFRYMKKWQYIRNKFSRWYVKYKFSSTEKRELMTQQLLLQLDYVEYVDFIKTMAPANHKCFPGITPMWDNSARRKSNAFLFKNSSPSKYKEWLEYEIQSFSPFSRDENFLFINAWNEWGEGNHLEPCRKYGREYLEVTKEVLKDYKSL